MTAESSNNNINDHSNLAERFKTDVPAFGGLLFLLGAVAASNPLYSIAVSIVAAPGASSNSATATRDNPLWCWELRDGDIQGFIGVFAMLVGYLAFRHNYHHRKLTFCLIAVAQLAWIPFVSSLSHTGMGAVSDPNKNPFIPVAYNPTSSDVFFVGTMAMLSVLAYGISFMASVGLMGFCLFADQSSAGRSMATVYTFGFYSSFVRLFACLLTMAGISQMLLGIWIVATLGSSPLEDGPIVAAVYIIHFPTISVVVGILQVIMGLWGLCRLDDILDSDVRDMAYQVGIAFTWVSSLLSMVIVTSLSWDPEDIDDSPIAPYVPTLVLSLCMMVAFLDYKVHNTVQEIPDYSVALEASKVEPQHADIEIENHDVEKPEQQSRSDAETGLN